MAIAHEVKLKQPAETSHPGEKARTRRAPRNGADAPDQLIGSANIDASLLVIQPFLPRHLNVLVFAWRARSTLNPRIPRPPASAPRRAGQPAVQIVFCSCPRRARALCPGLRSRLQNVWHDPVLTLRPLDM